MRILFDLEKRKKTLAERGLDFEDAAIVFQGITLEIPDESKEYGEVRETMRIAAHCLARICSD